MKKLEDLAAFRIPKNELKLINGSRNETNNCIDGCSEGCTIISATDLEAFVCRLTCGELC